MPKIRFPIRETTKKRRDAWLHDERKEPHPMSLPWRAAGSDATTQVVGSPSRSHHEQPLATPHALTVHRWLAFGLPRCLGEDLAAPSRLHEADFAQAWPRQGSDVQLRGELCSGQCRKVSPRPMPDPNSDSSIVESLRLRLSVAGFVRMHSSCSCVSAHRVTFDMDTSI